MCSAQRAKGKGEVTREAEAALGAAGWRRQQRTQGARARQQRRPQGAGQLAGRGVGGGVVDGVGVSGCVQNCPGGRGGNQAATADPA
jgi:hypothetical protein